LDAVFLSGNYPGVYSPALMKNKNVRAAFWQLYADHIRTRASVLLGDATLMVLVILSPMILLVGSKVMEALGASPVFVRVGETIDGIWLILAIGITCIDSAGKLFMLSIVGWREALQKKP
jgi:hypothetical protein